VADPGAAGEGVVHQRCRAGHRLGADQRSDRGSVPEGRADPERLDRGAELRQELLDHLGMHVEAVGRRAGLAAVAELRDHRACHRGVDVRVRGDHERRVAAELHRGVHDPLRGLAEQRTADAG